MTTAAKNLAAALALADAGFRVFPARAIYNPATQRWNKPPCISGWQSLATDDLGQIKRWWHQHPDAIRRFAPSSLSSSMLTGTRTAAMGSLCWVAL